MNNNAIFELSSEEKECIKRFWELQGNLKDELITKHIIIPKNELYKVGPNEILDNERLSNYGYTIIPVTKKEDSNWFEAVHKYSVSDGVYILEKLEISDFISDETTLENLFELFIEKKRLWFFTLSGNTCNGMVTYWDFANKNSFRIALFNSISMIENRCREFIKKKSDEINKPESFFELVKSLRLKNKYNQLDDPSKKYYDSKKKNNHSCPTEYLNFNDYRYLIKDILKKSDLNSKVTFNDSLLGNINNFRNEVMHSRTIISDHLELERIVKEIVAISKTLDALNEITSLKNNVLLTNSF